MRRAVLAALAVAGRPLAEDLLGEVTGLEAEAVRRGLRELAAARLLADDTTGGAHRPRHALLAEAVAAGLLPGERAVLHERTARALAAAGDEALAAEVAGHWAGRGPPGRGTAGPGGGGRGRRAGVRLRRGGGALAAGHRTVPGAPGAAGAAGIDAAAAVCAGHRCARAIRRQRARRRGRRGGLPPVRRSPRPGHRRGHLPPRRVLPGDRGARCRAAADRGGAAAVRAGSAVGRSRRGLARLRQRLPAARRGAAGGQPSPPWTGRWRSPKRPAPPR